ncbi:LVIVD repeat-containing protein [Halomicrobium katesii]|uniref:LVIVD repeat-containing protein n=1 Tax=Halomicrobium katesii TaxID=437163 RepID=UPI00036C4992|nr:hypothetical protein [Halomicrobium katesii]
MRRRPLLRTLGSGLALGSAGLASGHPTATSDGTPPAETPDSQPLGTVSIENVREMVLNLDGTVAYVATVDGFAVVDVSDPTEMRVLARERLLADHADGPLSGIWDLHCDGDRLLVAGPANGGRDSVRGFGYVDVSDPADPELLAEHEVDFYTHNCVLADGVGYFTGGGLDGSPLVVADPESGTELARWSVVDVDDRWAELPFGMVNLHDVWVHDDRAYLAYWDAGTWCLDVSDPGEPTLVSRVRGRPLDDLLDVTNRRRERTEPPGNDHFVTVNETGDLLGIGTESWAAASGSTGPGGIAFYDVTDPAEPTRLGAIDPPPTPDPTRGGVWTTAHNFELVDGRCYAAWYQGGVTVHDVTDATDPVERFHWRDAGRGKFWTAQLAAPGEFFLGASIGAFGVNTAADSPLESALFAFPDQRPADGAPTTDGTRSGRASTPTSETGAGAGVGAGLLGLLGAGAWCRRRSE